MHLIVTLRPILQSISDHLPLLHYEEYFHRQASVFSIESQIIFTSAKSQNEPLRMAIVEFLLPNGRLTLEGYGSTEYYALKDALNVFHPERADLVILPPSGYAEGNFH